jgi:hypothetical protein
MRVRARAKLVGVDDIGRYHVSELDLCYCSRDCCDIMGRIRCTCLCSTICTKRTHYEYHPKMRIASKRSKIVL